MRVHGGIKAREICVARNGCSSAIWDRTLETKQLFSLPNPNGQNPHKRAIFRNTNRNFLFAHGVGDAGARTVRGLVAAQYRYRNIV